MISIVKLFADRRSRCYCSSVSRVEFVPKAQYRLEHRLGSRHPEASSRDQVKTTLDECKGLSGIKSVFDTLRLDCQLVDIIEVNCDILDNGFYLLL
mmetsp:Transcript_106724/g.332796  ORF Transcript_106724/g.332796 Transcript_106724/m.332796 type:complete len:96 (+) Transcript_106724:80-367(+)